MKTLKNKIQKTLEVEMINYLCGAKSANEFINEILRPLTEVSEEQEQKISDILDLTQREWENADCDAEGATQEQAAHLDRIIEDAAFSIAELF